MKTVLLLLCGTLMIMILNGQRVMTEELPKSMKVESMQSIFSFDKPEDSGQWVSVNDNVMGGLSEGVASLTVDSCLLFSGTISLENNGGFASIRTLPKDFNLGEFRGVRIKVKGDGRAYQFRIRTDGEYDGIAFKHDFRTTPGNWIEIDLPFSSFLPVFRGRILRDVEPLVADEIRQLGFLIADKAAGSFSLTIDEISAIR